MKLLADLPLENAPEGSVFDPSERHDRLSPFGDWTLHTWLHGIAWEWVVREDGGRKVLEHPTVFTSCIRAGDGSWGDFTVEAEVRQMHSSADTSMDEIFNTKGRVGVMFRYLTYRQTYALFLECQERAVLYRRDDEKWLPLASREMAIDPAHYYRFKIECEGDRIRCWIDGKPLFDLTDGTFRRGRVALYANTLGRYGFCRVSAGEKGAEEAANYVSSERAAAAKAAEGIPRPVLWKRIPTVARTLDVSPDGHVHGAIAKVRDPGRDSTDKHVLVAVNLDGSVRWRKPCHSDAVPQVWDLDGDGRQDVIVYDGPTMRLLDIDTGETKAEEPTPACNERGNRGGRENCKPYVPLYGMYPANVRGTGPGRDLMLKDVGTAFWILNDRLQLEWWKSRAHGHDIGRYDVDGDGKDEIMCDYTMYDHDGSEMWTVKDSEYLLWSQDHVDRVVIGEFDGDPGTGLEIALAAGNNGFLLLDQEGRIRAHHKVGHAQHVFAGRFRPDLPGMQFHVGCRWGNPGSRILFSGTGDKLWAMEPDSSRSGDRLLRWTEDRDFILVVSTVAAAGLYDGHGRRLIAFPEVEASERDWAPYCRDLTGNGFDDFVIPTDDAMLIYTQGEPL